MENEVEALQNFATRLELKVNVGEQNDKRKKPKYYLTDSRCAISPKLDYNTLNHFMLGYSIALKLKNYERSL